MEPTCGTCGAVLPAGARFCPACAAPVGPDAGGGPADEARKLVTVLFADVTGSTALGERLDPERLRAVLQAWYSAASAAIEAWGGTVEKFIGDAIVAVFGVPAVREDDAERALRAALEILDRLPELNRRFHSQHGVELAVRIGVNSGEVIAPLSASAGAPLVTGDAVNVAARLEQAADPGSILVGERTWLGARDAFGFGDPIGLELKGKAEPVTARRLIAAAAESRRGIPGLRAPMVGRDHELDALIDALDRTVADGRPTLAVVYGPAGIGKSRLVQETLRSLDGREPTVRVLRGRCLSAGRGITYWALAEVVRAAAGISLDEPVEDARAKLRTALRGVLAASPDGGRDADSTFQALALTAGISLQEDALGQLEPVAVADELARAWPRFLTALATAGPVVLVIEDLHWASPELLTMLERILARSTGPLLVIATARPEFAQAHPGFAAGREDVATISLRPLSGEQGSRLVDELLATADLPEPLRREILARAEGNPFFLEEILRRLIDEGALVRDAERWRATSTAVSVQLPDTIQSLLAARIDALTPEERRVLQEAAVVGRIFWAEPVQKMLGGVSVRAELERLEARGLVAVRPSSTIGGQVEYLFRHALIRDVAYGSLPRKRRARAHAEAAVWLEDLASGEGFLDLVAHHYAAAMLGDDADLAWADDPAGRGEVRTRAFPALLVAGEVARQRYDLDVAADRHRAALQVAQSDDERARAWEALGDDEGAAFHGEGWDAYEEAARIARRRGDGATIARVALKTAKIATRVGTFSAPPSIDRLEAFIDEGLANVADDATRARLLIEKGANLFSMRDAVNRSDPVPFADRVKATQEAAAIATRLGDPDLLLEAEVGLGALHWQDADREALQASADRAVELTDRVSSPTLQALALYEASVIYRDPLGDLATSLELARRSEKVATNLSPHELMHATAQEMVALYWLGRWNEFDALLEMHLGAYAHERNRTCTAVRNGPAIGALMSAERGEDGRARELLDLVAPSVLGADSAVGFCALTDVALDDPSSAVARTSEGLLAHRRAGYPYVLMGRMAGLAAQADWNALGETLPQARDLVPQMQMMGPATDRFEAALRVVRGDREAAVGLLRRALEGFVAMDMAVEAATTREQLAALTAEPERRSLLDAALETYEAVGARRRADRARAVGEGV